ncbi:MAG TPA: hypothetical protein VGJ57_00655 [Nitrospirales bacterium]|jgi:hypothetical protein
MDALQRADWLVLDVIQSRAVPLTFAEIIDRIPELSWNQVFLAVDALSRRGEIILSRRGFEYQAMAAGDLSLR